MLYAVLAYHDEALVQSWSQAEDDALMQNMHRVHDKLLEEGRLGPAARLGPTVTAATLQRGKRRLVTDGPFAETKEQLLGFYVMDFPDLDAAVAALRELGEANPSALYEIRPIVLYLPGESLAG